MTKLHYALQKKSEQFSNFVQGAGTNKSMIDVPLNRNVSNPSASILSGSQTANQLTVRGSHLEGNEQFNEDEDHETI